MAKNFAPEESPQCEEAIDVGWMILEIGKPQACKRFYAAYPYANRKSKLPRAMSARWPFQECVWNFGWAHFGGGACTTIVVVDWMCTAQRRRGRSMYRIFIAYFRCTYSSLPLSAICYVFSAAAPASRARCFFVESGVGGRVGMHHNRRGPGRSVAGVHRTRTTQTMAAHAR